MDGLLLDVPEKSLEEIKWKLHKDMIFKEGSRITRMDSFGVFKFISNQKHEVVLGLWLFKFMDFP